MGLKLGLMGMVVLGALCGWLYIQGQWKDMEILGLKGDVANLTIERDIALANVTTAEDRAEAQATQIAAFVVKMAEIEAERAESRIRVDYIEGLFKDDRFQRLLGTNPTLIQLRMRKATAKVLKELEDATK